MMAKLIKNMYDTQTNPNYGGSVKKTTPDIKKVTQAGPQDKRSLQRDNAKAEKKYQHAVKPWKSKAKPATSKGGCDVPGDKPSTRTNDPKGALRLGYTKK
jgi:hypothetical protein